MATEENNCLQCNKIFAELRCSRCKFAKYCNAECQRANWSKHKVNCKPAKVWYDAHRACQDGGTHFGKLELMTWDGDDDGLKLGWGGVIKEEEAEHKRKFLAEYGGDQEKFFDYWPGAFRWTCCGTSADMNWGCDHHGGKGAKRPCTCDFCKMGKPLPDSVYNERKQSRHGLSLSRGPDPRSYNAAAAQVSQLGRSMMGLPM